VRRQHGNLPAGKAQEKARNEMVKAFEAELKEWVQGLLEALIREKRAMYLEARPTSANGYYTRDLLTS